MKRYTATFRCPNEAGGELRRSLDRHLYGSLPVYALGEDAAPEPGLWQVELGSDARQREVRRALESFGEQAGLGLVRLSWGWSLSRAELEGCDRAVPPPVNRQYQVPLRPVFVTLGVYLSGLLIWGWVLAFGLNNFALLWPALVLTVGWSFALTRVGGAFTFVSRLEIDEEGLEAGYWLPPWARLLDWREVDCLLLRPAGGGCQVSGAGKRLELPLRLLAGREESRELLRAIVCRAGLVLAEDKPMGGATYRRPDVA